MEKLLGKVVKKKAKDVVDEQLDTDGEAKEDERESPKPRRGLMRRLSDRIRRRSSSLRPNGRRSKSLSSRTSKGSATTKESNPSDTETPLGSADEMSGDESINGGRTDLESDWESASTASNTGEEEADDRRRQWKEWGKRQSKDPATDPIGKPTKEKCDYIIQIRVIEAAGLSGNHLKPLVRVNLGGKSRTTRTLRFTNSLYWNQTLGICLKTTVDELSALSCRFSVYSANRILRNSLLGSADLSMAMVLSRPERSIVEKWVPLNRNDEDDDDEMEEIVDGYLLVSIGVHRSGHRPPSLYLRGKRLDSDQILYGLCRSNYFLRVRLYELLKLADRICMPHTDQSAAELAVEVKIGNLTVISEFRLARNESMPVGDECLIPIIWPNIVERLRFRIIASKVTAPTRKRQKRTLCTAFLPLKAFSRLEEPGFMPTFGPSFLNFYSAGGDPNDGILQRAKRERSRIRDGESEGIHFCGRLRLSVDCEEGSMGKPAFARIPDSAVNELLATEQRQHFTVFCSFFAANHIHHEFKNRNIQFAVSMGHYGNADYAMAVMCSNRTLPSMPAYDNTALFAMPWGSHKPVCEIPCEWERIGRRIEEANILLKMADLLTKCCEEAAVGVGNAPEESAVPSIVVEALEEVADCFETFKEVCKRNYSSVLLNNLDINLVRTRLATLNRLYDEFVNLKYEKSDISNLDESAVGQLGGFAATLRELAADPMLSFPDIIIHMIVDGKVVGFVRIPPNEVFYGSSSILCGKDCGRIQALPLQWASQEKSKTTEGKLPAIVLAKLWLGPSKHRKEFIQQIQPGVLKYYAEVFTNQSRSAFSSEWKLTSSKPFGVSDECGEIDLTAMAITPPAGWKFGNDWKLRRTHDMWIGPDAGHSTFEDEFFEVEKRDEKTGTWKSHQFTDYFGTPIDRQRIHSAPKGWLYETGWQIDYHCVGDANGWQYSMDANFSADYSNDVEYRTHMFRRRRHKRRRRFKNQTNGMAEMFENPASYAASLDNEGWEYAAKWGEPLHAIEDSGDQFRRRRLVREMTPNDGITDYDLQISVVPSVAKERTANAPTFISYPPRVYEEHDTASVYQLRVYVLWGRELFAAAQLSRAFVRVFFLNRCQQSAVVESSLNPIWNETLLFERMIIPGGLVSLKANPPEMIVECLGEKLDGTKLFLGRFHARPLVINSATDLRGDPIWFPLKFPDDKTQGAVLMHSHLFQSDPTTKSIIPPIPNPKSQPVGRFEVPTDVRPKFGRFTVQVMAWGVRDLRRYQLLPIRSPFIEITVADRRDRTDAIRSIRQNPNFESPLLTFANVEMPIHLRYAPPIVLALRNERSWAQPLVGMCVVKNLQRYMRSPPPPIDPQKLDAEWAEFDRDVAAETLNQTEETGQLKSREPAEYLAFPDDPNSPPIDWWSKYYFSKKREKKCPGYGASGLEALELLNGALEDWSHYGGFGDFLDTFAFVKPNRRSLKVDSERKGELKGKLFITAHEEDKTAPKLSPPSVEFSGPVECVVRIYVIRAFDLISQRRNGLCDPYLVVRCGKKKFKGHKEYVADSVTPLFGRCVEMNVTIPQDKDLTVTVMDRRLLISDDEIGSTRVDLENRLLTRFRATVGLPREYNVVGPLPWRDQLTPLQTLRRFCAKMNVAPPRLLNADADVGIEMMAVEFWASRVLSAEADGGDNPKPFVGRPIQRVALHILHRIGLVPEHVETRPLYSSLNPDMESGALEMFVDIFPKPIADRIPPPLNIAPRQPRAFQLRLVVWELRNVIMLKKSLGRPAADLYVRCYLNGMPKAERTDVHFRCLEGAASFNWRFLFDFDFDVFEQRIQAYRKRRLFRKRSSELVDPVLIVEIWDNNKFSHDNYIGQCQLNLLGFEEGQTAEDEMQNVKYDLEKKGRTCCICCQRMAVGCWQCCCKAPKRKRDPFQMPRAPRYIPNTVGRMSLFAAKAADGWWPCLSSVLPDAQKEEKTKREKKDDQTEPDNASNEYVTGMVKMELQLLPLEDARAEPVGRKRNKPNHSPFLPKPKRPSMDSFWITSRLKAAGRICWRKSGGWSCVWMVLLAVLLTFVVLALIFQLPSIIATHILPF